MKRYKPYQLTLNPFNKILWESTDGFILVYDTREQQPLFKRPPKGLCVVRNQLPHGDYSIRGFESEICVERKSLSDLYSSLGSDRKRFIQTLVSMADANVQYRYLVIEGTEYEVLSLPDSLGGVINTSSRHLTASSIRQALVKLELVFNMRIYYGDTRRDCERFILDRFRKFYIYKREGKL